MSGQRPVGNGAKKILTLVIVLLVALVSYLVPSLGGGDTSDTTTTSGIMATSEQGAAQSDTDTSTVEESGTYTSKDEVAAYIHKFGHLPSNFISKTKAREAGWVASQGNLDEACPGKSIGGSRFYNDDGLLPDAPGRTWTECDIDYHGGSRGAKRIVFSNDGLIYYTADHYKTFEQLY